LDGARVHEGVVHHQRQAASLGFLDQALGLLRCRRHRFLDQDVLAGSQRGHREVEMGRDWSRDHDCVERRIVQQIPVVCGRRHARVAALDRSQALLAHIRDLDHLSTWVLGEVANQVGSPIAVTDDADPERRDNFRPPDRVLVPSHTIEIRVGSRQLHCYRVHTL
jgi:hypothetical protein